MEQNVKGDVLLLGEANFSFTLSLLQFCDPKYVTTSCYETRDCAVKKYGEERVNSNLKLLQELSCKRVLFGIDACNLKACLPSDAKQRFERVIFMFPHVGGKSNLKKNRMLVDNFLRSSRDVLDLESPDRPSVFLTLAKGQGGTMFEEDPAKRNLKDSWQALQLAHKNGFIMTECSQLDESKFSLYSSTGFRSQAKSFTTRAGLVHRFETSLALPAAAPDDNNFFALNFLETSKRLINTRMHPLNELKHFLGNCLAANSSISFEIISDRMELNISAKKSEYNIGKELVSSLSDANNNLKNRELFLRSSLDFSSINASESNTLKVFGGLVVAKSSPQESESFHSIVELNNLRYDLLIAYFPGARSPDSLEIELVKRIESLVPQKVEVVHEIVDCDCFKSKLEYLYVYLNGTKRQLVEMRTSVTEFRSVVNASLLLSIVFDLTDERLLYSEDKRVFVPALNGIFKTVVRPYSIGNLRWLHDISFWYDPGTFKFKWFVDCVRNNCMGLVRSIEFLEEYREKKADSGESRHAACLRLVYESCDRALGWEQSSQIQLRFRDCLQRFDGVLLR